MANLLRMTMAVVSLLLDTMPASPVLRLLSRPGPGSSSTLMAHLFLVSTRSRKAADIT